MSDATYYNWKAKYAGLTVSELKRLKVLEEENRRLKQIVGEQALDIRALKELLAKNFLKPGARRLAVSYARESLGLSERKACLLVNISASAYRYRDIYCGTRIILLDSPANSDLNASSAFSRGQT
jgi:putative transposase